MSQQQFGRVWEVYKEVVGPKPRDSPIQMNEVITILIELGLTSWPRLPAEMRRGMFRRRKFSRRQKFLQQVQERVSRLAEKYRLDERLALAVPSAVKSDLRMVKNRTGVSMSAQVRNRLMKGPA